MAAKAIKSSRRPSWPSEAFTFRLGLTYYSPLLWAIVIWGGPGAVQGHINGGVMEPGVSNTGTHTLPTAGAEDSGRVLEGRKSEGGPESLRAGQPSLPSNLRSDPVANRHV